MTKSEAQAEVVILRVEKEKLLTAWAKARDAAEKVDALMCARLKRTVKVERELLEMAKNWSDPDGLLAAQLTAWARQLGVPIPTNNPNPIVTNCKFD